MILKKLLERAGISQCKLAHTLGVSPSAINRIILYGIWPKTGQPELKNNLKTTLAGYGFKKEEIDSAIEQIEAASASGPASIKQEQQEDIPVSSKQTLSREAKTKFRIPREIFSDNLTDDEDVYFDDDIRYVEQSLYATAKFGGMLALMGESGSGKSTVFDYLESRLELEGETSIRFAKPYVLGMVSSTKKSRGMTINDICESVLEAVDPGVKYSGLSAEGRFKRMHQLLMDAYPAIRVVIVIEEGHSMPQETVKMLKRLLELKKGVARLLSIIVIGQTAEMRKLFSTTRADVREVVQRTEFVELEALSNVESYVRHRCQRAGANYDAIFDKDAMGELRLKLSGPPEKGKKLGKSLLYPLLVGNVLTQAINRAARLGADKVDAEIIRLPD